MAGTLTEKLIEAHLVEGHMTPGEEIAIRIDQTLTQDATGTLVMLELEAMGLDRVRTDVSVQYVDHNLLQTDSRNPDDHVFLRSAARRFGLWHSGPGNGVSHPVHQERFGRPGATMLGSDSHTPAAGSIGMLAIGAGGIDVALAMAGEPFRFRMPRVWGVRLEGSLPPWVSAKDVILELLRRHDVVGGAGYVLEYHGPGLGDLTAMDRHVIANMGTELGATTSVFPADDAVGRFLAGQGRADAWSPLEADPDAVYDREEEIDLGELEPLIAMPSSPGNVVPVREAAGETIYQSYIGSSANPGYRDFAVAAEIVKGRRIDDGVSFDVNPTSRQILANLIREGHLAALIEAGARIHQAGCNGCIGMGQAPATDTISLRTVPRNFPGRSGTQEDKVCLVSPETAAASALTGRITDPRTLDMAYPRVREPREPVLDTRLISGPLPPDDAARVTLEKGPNIADFPELDPLPDELEIPVLLVVGDDVSTDEIMPAGAKALPWRSNIPAISRFCFKALDPRYHDRAIEARKRGGHAIAGGDNYGQGSSREHAALAPRFLGLRVVIARSIARIHRQNLANFGVLPLAFREHGDAAGLEAGEVIRLPGIRDQIARGTDVRIERQEGEPLRAAHDLSPREVEHVLAGGLVNWMKSRR